MSRPHRAAAALVVSAVVLLSPALAVTYSWRYYRPTNTGIQGDYCDALWISADGDPWIGGYSPGFEEGGIAKFIQAEDRWVNISNVDYPAIGHPNDTGVARVADIVADAQGNLWMGTGRGALKFNPGIGPSSLVRYGPGNSTLGGGWTTGVELAPDGTIWFSSYTTVWGWGGLNRYNPATNQWTSLPNYGDGNVAVQPKPTSGYYVWDRHVTLGLAARWDSTTQTWTHFSNSAGNPAGLPGKACTDAAGNTWMYRYTNQFGSRVLDCRRPNGTWVGTPQVPSGEPLALRAYGDLQALAGDSNGQVWRFNGTAWQSLGHWSVGSWTYDLGIDSTGNVWACGIGGAAKRSAATGQWQRYRVTNTSQYDFFNSDLAIDPQTGHVWACANAGPGVGGGVAFDGVRWTGFNNDTYGLGVPWPFPTDNSQAVGFRPSLGRFVVNPTYGGLHEFTGTGWITRLSTGTVKGVVEDSLGRLWMIGEYFDLRYYNGASWISVPIACWGANIQRDPDRPGTVWACANCEVVRTDGVYRFSRENTQLPGLDPQSDMLTTVAVGRNGVAWVGSSRGVHRLDAAANSAQYFPPGTTWLQGGTQIEPRVVTPDGRLWFTTFGSGDNPQAGLGWYDGVRWGMFPGPTPSGAPQWGGLPHAQVWAAVVRPLADGYEIWLSCPSRGLAVLTVTTGARGDLDCDGDVDFDDIDPFIAALSGQSAYGNAYPNCSWMNADCNDDGRVNFDDVDGFVARIGS